MNYQIIRDEDKLREFIEWLPEPEENEKFYCCLFARKKYANASLKSSDKTHLKRFLSDKGRLFEKIKQLEVARGAYKIGDVDAPEESLVLYINPNPRDLRKASFDGIAKIAELLKHEKQYLNPHSELMNCIQRSSGKKHYLDFDIDTRDFDFQALPGIINVDCLKIVETRGGYHILVRLADLAPEYTKSFHRDLKALGVDQTGDQLLPVPGCIQGGFMPRFIDVFS